MATNEEIELFLSKYPASVIERAGKLRLALLQLLPGVMEQIDVPAKMIAYCYGQRYADMICCIFPSQKGLKLSFYRGIDLPDPYRLLEGNAKTTRYVAIGNETQINSLAMQQLLSGALAAFNERINNQ